MFSGVSFTEGRRSPGGLSRLRARVKPHLGRLVGDLGGAPLRFVTPVGTTAEDAEDAEVQS
jgi:hypothetical protein